MASLTESEVKLLMQTFVEHFVKEYETQLAFYNLVLRGEASKSGKIAETLSGKLGQGLGGIVGLVLGTAVGMPGAGVKGGASVGESLAKAVGDKLGSQEHAKKVQCVSELLKKATESKEDFRRSLVEAAADVFQSFEMQFCRVTSELSPDNAMVRLAQDAVNRSINYFVAEQKSNLEINIAHSIMLGKSKIESVLSIPVPTKRIKSPGYEVTYKHMTTTNTWNTASLYTKTGILRNNEYFKRMDSSSRTDKYGYRRLLKRENWDCMKSDYCRDNVVESKSFQFADYNYILSTNNMPDIISSLLKNINDNDATLSEQRIKELILECNENIISEITNLKDVYKDLKNKTATEIIEHLDSFERILTKSNFVDFYAEMKNSLIGVFNQQEDILGFTRKTAEDIRDIKATIQSLNRIPATASVLFNVKKPVKSFTGRSKELENIHSALQISQREVVISQVTSVCGLGGIGKSELARKYASEYEEFYEHNIIWINAESQGSLKENFLKLSERTKATKQSPNISISDIVNNVYMYFRQSQCLFVFDNAEELDVVKQFLPSKCSFSSEDRKPFLLITSRNQEWDIGEEGDVTVLKLNGFSAEEATNFVKKSLNIEDDIQDESIKELIKGLEYFPLALVQATAYIREKNIKLSKRGHGKYLIKDYIAEMKLKNSDFLKFPPKSSSDRYLNSVFNTWEITLRTINSEKDIGWLAIEIFCRLSYLAADDIVADALLRCFENKTEQFWDSIDLLSRYSMIILDEGLISIHRLVQEVTRLKMKEAGMEEQVLNDIISTMVETNWTDFEERIKLLQKTNSEGFRLLMEEMSKYLKMDLNDTDQEILTLLLSNGLRINPDADFLHGDTGTILDQMETSIDVLCENLLENTLDEKFSALNSRLSETIENLITYYYTVFCFSSENMNESIREKSELRGADEASIFGKKSILKKDYDKAEEYEGDFKASQPTNSNKDEKEISENDTDSNRVTETGNIVQKRNPEEEYLLEMQNILNEIDQINNVDESWDSNTMINICQESQEAIRHSYEMRLCKLLNEMEQISDTEASDEDSAAESNDTDEEPMGIIEISPEMKAMISEGLSRINDEIAKIKNKGDRHIISAWKHAITNNNLLDKFHTSRYGNQKLSLLHILAKGGDKNAIERFLSYMETTHDKDVSNIIDSSNLYSDSPLHIVAANNELEIVKYLISKGADYKNFNSSNLSPLEVAAVNGNLEIVMFLVENKYYLSSQICPSQIVWMGRVHVIRYLIEKRFDLSAKYEGPFHLFSMFDAFSLCLLRAMIPKDLDLPHGDIYEESAWEMAELLLKHLSKATFLTQSPREAFSKYLEISSSQSETFEFREHDICIDYDEAKKFVWSLCCG